MFLFEIAIYFWFRSIRGTTEFQFAFRCKSTRNYIFEVTNCGRITLIFLSVGGTVVSVVSFATVIWYVTQRAPSLPRGKAYSDIRQKEVISGRFPITKSELARCCLRDEGPI